VAMEASAWSTRVVVVVIWLRSEARSGEARDWERPWTNVRRVMVDRMTMDNAQERVKSRTRQV